MISPCCVEKERKRRNRAQQPKYEQRRKFKLAGMIERLSLLKIRSERKLEHAHAGESFDCDHAATAATEIAHGFHPNQKEQSSIKKGVLDVAPVGATASTVSAKGHAAKR